MNQLSYLLREFSRAVWRNPGAIIGSLISLTLLFILWNLFWVTTRTVNNFYDELLTDIRVELFVTDSLPDSLMMPVIEQVIALKGVQDVQFISRQQARDALTELLGTDLLAGYDTLNPLPRSLVLSLTPESRNLNSILALEQQADSLHAVEEVSYSRQWLEQVEKTRGVLGRAALVLGAMILLTALISSANAIRLTTRARATGLQQLRLLGAGKLFVAFPYILEGKAVGLLAAGLSWAVLFFLRTRVSTTQFTIVFPEWEKILVFVVAATAVGMLSGFLGIRRYLK